MSRFGKICVIGLGYIGLPTSVVFAHNGLDVVGVDVDEAVVSQINSGKSHILEPDLDILLRKVVESGKLITCTQVQSADCFILAVPTPFKDDNVPDLRYIEAATRSIAPALEKNNLVILESTSPVGTTENLSTLLAQLRSDLSFPHTHGELSDIRIAHCPERVLPGQILREVVENDRIIGGLTRKCAQSALALYRIISKGEIRLTNAPTAEMVKLSENAFRDVNIAFANELSMICETLRISVWDVIKLANRHPRVNILRPGPGVGGHCIAVDPWFIVASDRQNTRLIQVAREINQKKPQFIIEKVKLLASKLKVPTIACLGLSYKANVGDLRESPAVEIVSELCRLQLGQISIVEPHIEKLPRVFEERGLQLCDFQAAIERSNILLLLVDHESFLNIDREILNDKIVIDTRGVW